MSSTTPAPERAPSDRAGGITRPAPGATMRILLAACAAAEAVSTPPAPPGHRRPEDARRTAA